MIHRKPTTAKGYHYYGKLMWGRIVKEMEKGAELDNTLKKSVWNSLFSFSGYCNNCFSCAWANKMIGLEDEEEEYESYAGCDDCLLDVDESDECLDGLYDTATGISGQRIEAARKIRDLPMKDKWK